MRIAAFLLMLLPAYSAEPPKLTPKDESEIRAAIYKQAMKENENGTDEVWSEHGPFVYHIGSISAVTADVATAEADGVRAGTFPERLGYVFILTRSSGRWVVAKKLQVCPGSGFKLIGPLPRASRNAMPQSGGPGFLGCPG